MPLYVIATPIGNLSDLTERAIELLKNCDCIACEDTRVTRKLLMHIGSDRPVVSYRDANEQQQALYLFEKLKAGNTVALVCDAGTPTISDPGFRLVRECRRHGLSRHPRSWPFSRVGSSGGLRLSDQWILVCGVSCP